MNAESQYTITGQHGQSLNINPQKPDPNLASIIEYAGKTGNKLQVVYCDKSRYTYDAEHVGISSLEATKQIEGWIKNWVREMLEGQGQTLTEQYSELCCNQLLTTVKSRRARGEPSLLELSRVRRRKTKSKLTKKDAGERVKDHSFCFWAKCSNSSENCN